MYCPMSRSFTSAAKVEVKPDGSNWVIGPAPDSPATSDVQLSSTVFPSGLTIPSPVMTIRRLPFSLANCDTLHPEPAVDEQHRARDEGRLIRAEEPHRAGNVLGLSELSERRRCQHRGRRLLREGRP